MDSLSAPKDSIHFTILLYLFNRDTCNLNALVCPYGVNIGVLLYAYGTDSNLLLNGWHLK